MCWEAASLRLLQWLVTILLQTSFYDLQIPVKVAWTMHTAQPWKKGSFLLERRMVLTSTPKEREALVFLDIHVNVSAMSH